MIARLAPALAALLACSTAGEPTSSTGGAPLPRRVVEASAGPVVDMVLLSGELEAVSSTELSVPRTQTWQLTIQWIVEDGARLAKGERAIEFDNSAFTANLEQQRLLVKQARRDYATQRALQKMAIADKQHAVNTTSLARDRAALYAEVARDLLPERDWQERQLALERASAGQLSAREDLDAATRAAALDLKVKRIELDKAERAVATAEAGIAALTMTAPEDGLALIAEHPWEGRKLNAGDTVQTGWAVVEMPDLSSMRISARLSDVDDGRIEVGRDAVVVFDAFPDRPIAGRVDGITAVAREVGFQSLQRAFDVHVSLTETDESWMRPGMSARVEIVSTQVSDAVVIPRAAVRGGGATDAFDVVLDGGERRAVKLGVCGASRCAVTEGLVAGDKVVVGGAP